MKVGASIAFFLTVLLVPFPVRPAVAAASPCGAFSASGYLFDPSYESEEYVGGFLQIHLRMLPKYDDGRGIVAGFKLYRADCSSEYVQVSVPGFGIPPNVISYSIRFTSATHFDFWDDDHGVQISSQNSDVFPWHTDIPATMSDQTAYAQVSYNGYIAGEGTSVESTSMPVQGRSPDDRDPVMVIPGILGSVMQDQDKTIWPNLPSMLLDRSSSFMDSLAMSADGTPTDANVFPASVLDKIGYTFGTFHYTDQLTSTLQAAGYSPNKNMFMFQYDWRLGPEALSAQLSAKISDVLSETGAPHVDVIAHSYGGLVMKQYLAGIHAANPELEGKIGKVVFVAVPNLGSAEAAKALIFGSDFGIPLLNTDEVQKLALNMPSMYALLPSSSYYNRIGSFYDDIANPLVKQALNHDQSESMLVGLGKNRAMLSAGDSFHSAEMDGFDFSGKPYSAYNILGCGVFTLKTIDRMYSGTGTTLGQIIHGPKYRIYADSGDGTVLMGSANSLALPQGSTFYVKGGEHSGMLSNQAVDQQVAGILTGSPSAAVPGVADAASGCELQGKLVSYPQNMDITITNLATHASVDPATLRSEPIDGEQNTFLPTGDGVEYDVVLTPPQATQTEVGTQVPTKEDISVSQVADQNTTVYTYDGVPSSAAQPVTIGVGDGAPTVTEPGSAGGTDSVTPTTSYDQGTLPTATALQTTIRSYLSQAQAAAGVLQMDSSDRRIQFTTSNAADFLGYYYSFDGGVTYTESDQSQTIATVPDGADSVAVYSISREDIAEPLQTVTFHWSTPAATQSPSTSTVIVEPPAQAPSSSQASLPVVSVDSEPSVDPAHVAEPTVPDVSEVDPQSDMNSSQPDGIGLNSQRPVNINITVAQPQQAAQQPPQQSSSQEPFTNRNPDAILTRNFGGVTGSVIEGILDFIRLSTRLIFF